MVCCYYCYRILYDYMGNRINPHLQCQKCLKHKRTYLKPFNYIKALFVINYTYDWNNLKGKY